MAFDRHRSGPPRISRWVIPSAEADRCRPRALRVAFSALVRPPELSQRRSASFLPLLGFVSPLRRSTRFASTPGSIVDDRNRPRPSLRVDDATRRLPFRPRGFAPPRRFPPRSEPRACCISLPAMGFVAFPGFPCPISSPSRPPERSMGAARYMVAVLATRSPFEESPSPPAAPRHRGRCLLAVFARVRPASNDLATAARRPARPKGDGTEEIQPVREPPKRSRRREPVERAHARP
jgi:hypothetical protein